MLWRSEEAGCDIYIGYCDLNMASQLRYPTLGVLTVTAW